MKVCRDMILDFRGVWSCALTHTSAGCFAIVTALALTLTCERAEMKAWIVSHIQTSSSVTSTQDTFTPIVYFILTPGLI